MFSAAIKFGLWLLALVGVYSWAKMPGVSNALLLFFTLGVVPGTHIVLSPQATFWWTGSVFIATTLFVFASNIRHGIQRRSNSMPPYDQGMEFIGASMSESLASATPLLGTARKPKPVVIITIPGRPGPLAHGYRLLKKHAPPFAIQVGAALGLQTARATQAIKIQAVQILHTLERVGVAALLWAGELTKRGLTLGIQFSRATWHRAEPHLRTFDAWLEKRIKQNEVLMAFVTTLPDVRPALSEWRLFRRHQSE